MHIDLIVLHRSTAHSLSASLESLSVQRQQIGTLYLVNASGAEPSDSDELSIARLGVRVVRRKADAANASESLNAVCAMASAELLLFLQAGDVLSCDYVDKLLKMATDSKTGGMFYASAAYQTGQDSSPVRLATCTVDAYSLTPDAPTPCVFSGTAIASAHFRALNGFHTGCQTVQMEDFWFRTFLKRRDALVYLGNAGITVARIPDSWLVRSGARWVYESMTLRKQVAGFSDLSIWYEYAYRLSGLTGQAGPSGLNVDEHLSQLAATVLFMVQPSQRSELSQYLGVSMTQTCQRAEIALVDQALATLLPSVDLLALPDLYAVDFNFFSLGSFCHAAQVLKDLALRGETGPFDWIFSSAAAAAHMLGDDFATFLNPVFCQEIAPEDRVDPGSNRCDHLFYRDHFGVRSMFNHHLPTEGEDAEFFRSAVDHLRAALQSGKPLLMLHIAQDGDRPEHLERLASRIADYPAQSSLLVVRFRQITKPKYLEEPVSVVVNRFPVFVELVLPVLTSSNGLYFAEPRDNQRLHRLVYSWAQLVLFSQHCGTQSV